MNKQIKADLMLVMVTVFWGASYLLTNICLKELGPMNLNAFRFTTAFLLLAPFFGRRLFGSNRTTLKYALSIGIALTATYVLYGYGLTRTSVSNAAFICALPVVTTPVMGSIFLKRRLSNRQRLCILLCVVGLALLTLNETLRPASGDVICMGVPVCYSVDLLLTERAVKDDRVDPVALGVLELGVVGVITLTASCAVETPRLPSAPLVWACALFLGLFCSGIAFVVQTIEQQYTTAEHVGLIFTLEPVFATTVAFALGGERLAPRCYIGMALMLLSLMMMELNIGNNNKKELRQERS